MDNDVTPEQIQQALQAGLSELGRPDMVSLRTTLLVRDRYYVGRRFVFDGAQAVFLSAENVVHFYDDNGKLLKSVAVAATQEQRVA